MIEGAWAVVDLLGHKEVVGQLSEVTVAGAAMLKIDTPSDPPRSVLVSAASLHAITPCTEEQARARVAPRPELSLPYEVHVVAPCDDDLYDDDDCSGY